MTHAETKSQKFKALFAKAIISLLALFSLKNCHRLGSLFGWIFSIIPNRPLHVTKVNVRLCFPEMNTRQQKQLIKKSLSETGKTLIEASLMWKLNKDNLFQLVKKVHGESILQDAINNKNGVILAFPHLGNWELLSLYCSEKYTTTTMYQKPKMIALDSIIKAGRERFGSNLVPADNHGVRAMYKALQKNEFVCILPDQEPTKGNGVYAPFFGLKAYSMTLISRLIKKTNATLVLAYTKRLSNGLGYEIYFSEVKNMSEKISSDLKNDSVTYLNAEIEKCIRDIPEQYQWSYKRFRTQPMDENGKPTADYYNN